MPVSSALTATTSSSPTPIGWPVKPLVLAITMRSACVAEDLRAARGSRPRRCRRARACRSRARRTPSRGAISCAAHAARLGLGDELLHDAADVLDVEARAVEGAVRGDRRRAPRRSASCPRSRAAPALSTTSAAAPMPRIIPWRRRSNGSAASSTTSSVAAAPEARKPAPSQPSSVSEVASSAATTTTRRQRPARIQSSASATACVVLAHAELICVLGPRAPISSANCEWPIESTRNRKRRSNV